MQVVLSFTGFHAAISKYFCTNYTLWTWFQCASYRKTELQITLIVFVLFWGNWQGTGVTLFSAVTQPMLLKLKIIILVDLLWLYVLVI